MRTPAQFAADAFATMPINEALGGNTLMGRLEAATASRDAEWRREVEEAQADAIKVAEVLKDTQVMNVEMRTERDRLKGELAGVKENLRDVHRVLEEAKGERAEAEQLVRDAMGRPEWTGWYTRAQQHFAATPAEQAQGEAAKCACADDPIGHHASPCPLAQAYADGTPMDEKTALAWAKIKGQQTSARYRSDAFAQVNARLDALDQRETDNAVLFSGQIAELNAQVAALAKRVDALEGRQGVHDTGARQIMQALERMAHRADALERYARGCDCAFGSKTCPQGCGIACATCVAERVCRPASPPPEAAGFVLSTPIPIEPAAPSLSREDARYARDRINPRPRDPEAAGPGHVFLKGANGTCRYVDLSKIEAPRCGRFEREHAVPPIPERGAR